MAYMCKRNHYKECDSCGDCKETKKLPICIDCGEKIDQDDAVCMNGDWYCDSCLNSYREDIYED